MNAKLKSYRAVVAEALAPPTPAANQGIVSLSDFRFEPSAESLRRARALGIKLTAIRAAGSANDKR